MSNTEENIAIEEQQQASPENAEITETSTSEAVAAVPETHQTSTPASHKKVHHAHHAHHHHHDPYNLHTHHHVPHHEEPEDVAEDGEGAEIFQDRESDGEGQQQHHYHSPSRHYGSPYSQRRHSVGGGPSEELLRTTAARELERIAWDAHLEEKRIRSSPMPIKKPDPNYVPGERLMKPTQSRIHERRQWEEIVKNKPYEDDIWWEKRRPAPVAGHKNHVPSRLNEPTVAALHGKREKFTVKKENERSRIESPHAHDRYSSVAPIGMDSPLLKTTAAFNHLQVDKEGRLLFPPEEQRHEPQTMPSKLSGPQVASKLMQKTRSSESSKWVEKKPEEKVLSQKLLQSIKPPSARLLEFNTAMKAQSRDKAAKTELDKREVGWNTFHHKDKIPDELPAFTPSLRWSTSPGNSPNRSRSMENGHMFDGAENQELYYEEDGEYGSFEDEEGIARGVEGESGGLEGDEEEYYGQDNGEEVNLDGELVGEEAEGESELLREAQADAAVADALLQVSEDDEEPSPVQVEQVSASSDVNDDSAGSNVDSETAAAAPALSLSPVEKDLAVEDAVSEEDQQTDDKQNKNINEDSVPVEAAFEEQ